MQTSITEHHAPEVRMTEQEWLESDDAHAMLIWLRESWQGSDEDLERLIRLYWLACCRRIWKLLKHKDSRQSLQVLQRYLDGTATDEEFVAAEWQAEGAIFYLQFRIGLDKIARWVKEIGEIPPERLRELVRPDHWGHVLTPAEILERAASFAHYAFINHRRDLQRRYLWQEPFLSAPLLREIAGNPFR